MADIFDLIADANRRAIIALLAERWTEAAGEPITVTAGDVAEALAITPQSATRQLANLRSAGLLVPVGEDGAKSYVIDTSPLAEVEAWVAAARAEGGATLEPNDVDATPVFSAWAGARVPEAWRSTAERLPASADLGASLGRLTADAALRTRRAGAHVRGAAGSARTALVEATEQARTMLGGGAARARSTAQHWSTAASGKAQQARKAVAKVTEAPEDEAAVTGEETSKIERS